LGREAEAWSVSEAALERPPDQTTPNHRLWLALRDAQRGDVEPGRLLLRDAPADAPSHFFQLLREVLEVMVLAAELPATADRKTVRPLVDKLRSAASNYPGMLARVPTLWRWYGRAHGALRARRAGGWRFWR